MAANRTSFQPGNTAAVTHGGRSLRVRENARKTLLSEMTQLITERIPELDAASNLLVELLACALADVRQLDDWINRQGGPVSVQGKVYNVMTLRRSRERDALALMDRLGVGPKARTQILGNAVHTEGLASQLARQMANKALPAAQR